MANASDKEAVFQQALNEAGFGDARKAECCRCYAAGDWKTIRTYFAEQRKALLEQVHAGQKRIDCLDYLAYTIRKDQNGG